MQFTVELDSTMTGRNCSRDMVEAGRHRKRIMHYGFFSFFSRKERKKERSNNANAKKKKI
jgi:hypothetical protein